MIGYQTESAYGIIFYKRRRSDMWHVASSVTCGFRASEQAHFPAPVHNSLGPTARCLCKGNLSSVVVPNFLSLTCSLFPTQNRTKQESGVFQLFKASFIKHPTKYRSSDHSFILHVHTLCIAEEFSDVSTDKHFYEMLIDLLMLNWIPKTIFSKRK